MAAENDEDLALSRRAAVGDRIAFGLLVEKHEAKLRAFLRRMAGAEQADDLAQEAFLKAWRAAGQYDGRARYATWLTRIAWRCRLDQLRAHRPLPAEQPAEIPSTASKVEMDDMLARLGDSERAALILCEGHGWSHREASDMLGLPLGTLKSTVARAKAKCRAYWSETGHG